MRKTGAVLLAVTLAAMLTQGVEQPDGSPPPETVVAGFGLRVDTMFRAESGQPLVRAEIRKPLSPGRGNFARHYSWSLVAFAARCLYLGEMLDEANAALVENARHYLDNPLDINDRDSFHWHADIVMRLIEMYGNDGTKHAGRITGETEVLALKPIWLYVKGSSSLDKAEYEESKTWYIYSSENHHVMDFTVDWHFAKLAKERPEYRNLRCDDGATLAEHYRAWNEYFLVYCRERARKSLCAEMMSDHYNSVWIKGLYNFRDFGDQQVRRSAGMLLDLYWAYWAQEQINGIQGGGKSRISFHEALQGNVEHGTASLAWFYFGIGERPAVHGQDMNAALSDYRPPAVVADIALDVAGRGRYEVRQRPQGLGQTGRSRPEVGGGHATPTVMRTDGGGILRYSYCDPAFIVGCPMSEARPLSDWAAISVQGRWQGVIFAGDHDARIVPIVRPANNIRALNSQWCVQSKGTLITQKLKYHKGAAEMIVWMSKEGLSAPVEEDGVVFVEAAGAYAAVRVAKGGFRWKDDIYTINKPEGIVYKTRPGRTMVPNDEFSPVILEVMAKTDVTSFDAFKAKVEACEISMAGPVLRYKTIYGDVLTMDTSFEKTPTINGKPVDYAPKKIFESPFLNADYNSGVVTISKGKREKVLDFTERPRGERTIKDTEDQNAFLQAANREWQEVFADACTGDWRQKWFLDGEIGTVKTDPEGMTLTAGPEFANDAHHMVLWTRQSFQGDLKIEYDYTRLDSEKRCVTILYIQATGSGAGPYDEDISKWNALRKVPSMKTYYNHMNTYHISYAAFPNSGVDHTSYIRGRRYTPEKTGLEGTELEPDYFSKALFATGVEHHITVIKRNRDLFMRVENADQVTICHMKNDRLPTITGGRIGLRHMFTRSSRYRNISISTSRERE